MQKKYQPSNGTERMIFQAAHCDMCSKDRYTEDHPERGCSILCNALMYSVDDKEYPQQWCVINGKPTCTAFKARKNPTQRNRRSKKTNLNQLKLL